MKHVLTDLLDVIGAFRARLNPATTRNVEPIDLGRALLKTVESRKKASLSTTYVPNSFTIYLHPNPAAAVKSLEHTLLEELKGVLLEKAEKESLSFIGPVEVLLKSDDQMTPSEIRVQADFSEGSESQEPGREERDAHGRSDLKGGTRLFRVVKTPSYPGRLTVIQHDGQRQEFPILPEVTKIGRGIYCSVRLSDPKASRFHASIHYQDNRFVIKDQDSTNGTYLNGTAVAQEYLTDNDVIQIGSTTLEFHIVSDSP